MLFNSYIFILLFLPLTWAVYFGLNSQKCFRGAQIALIIASFVFYGFYNWTYLVLMSGSIVVNYAVAYIAHTVRRKSSITAGKVVIAVGIIGNIGVLFYYKYMNFFLENVNSLFHTDLKLRNIVLPLGISFYTFQQISFLIDTYKEDIIYHFGDYAEFVCFFPQLVAGPIVSHDLIEQFTDRSRRKVNFDFIARGLFLFSTGLFKKIIIADTFAKAASWGFSNIDIMSGMDAVITMVAYTFQIYFDFSGYSDMAVGLASLFNIEIPYNFNAPYQSCSVTEFWKRWHITLTNFLTKYVYYPLGGGKRGKVRTYVNIMIVFLISGIWHGANWTFIIWGVIHGAANVVNRIFSTAWNKIAKGIRWSLTFIFICVTWVFFRADTPKMALEFLLKVFSQHTLQVTPELAGCFVLPEVDLLEWVFGIHQFSATNYVIMIIEIMMAFILILRVQPFVTKRFCPTVSNMIGTIICLTWSVFSLADNSPFIYFGF